MLLKFVFRMAVCVSVEGIIYQCSTSKDFHGPTMESVLLPAMSSSPPMIAPSTTMQRHTGWTWIRPNSANWLATMPSKLEYWSSCTWNILIQSLNLFRFFVSVWTCCQKGKLVFSDCPKDEQFFKESAGYTIKKWTARSNPWGLLVVFTFRGEETCGWSMVAFKLSETDLIMEDEQSQRAFEWLCFTILAYISRWMCCLWLSSPFTT